MNGTLKTTEVIFLASKLFDDCGYGRMQILCLLRCLIEYEMWDATEDTLLKVYDLIVG